MHAQCSECGSVIDEVITVGTCPYCGLVAYFSTPEPDVGVTDEDSFLFEPFMDATLEARADWEDAWS